MKTSLLLLTGLIGSLYAYAQDTSSLSVLPVDTTVKHIVSNKSIFHSVSQEYATYNIFKAINGAVPGLQITSGGGQPGQSPDIAIRGLSTFYLYQPTIVVDGNPYYGDINMINLNDIDNIKVLKDGEATVAYGNLGGNGVIEIHTKQAKDSNSKIHFSVDSKSGVSTSLMSYNTINDVGTYFELVKEALDNAGMRQVNVVDFLGGYNSYDVSKETLIDADGKLNSNAKLRYNPENWQKEIQRIGFRQDHTLTASANGVRGSFYLSGNYLKGNGYVKNTSFERAGLRFNGTLHFTKWLDAGVNSFFSGSMQHLAEERFLENAQLMAPLYPVYLYDSSGQKVIDPATGKPQYDYGSATSYNPNIIGRPIGNGSNVVAELLNDVNLIRSNALVISPFLEAKLLKYFDVKAGMDFNYQNSNAIQEDVWHDEQHSARNVLQAYGNMKFDYKIGLHNIIVDVGYREFKSMTRDSMFSYLMSNNQPGSYYGSDEIKDRNRMINAGLQYSFAEKIFINGGFNSSHYTTAVFHSPIKQSKPVWFIGAGYDFAKDIFPSNQALVELLKIKANYGTQNAIGNQIMAYNGGNNRFDNNMLFRQLTYNNGTQINVGLEASLLRERLGMQVNFYRRISPTNFVWTFSSPSGMVYSPFDSLSFLNKGLEVEANAVLVQKKDFTWTVNVLVTHAKSTYRVFTSDAYSNPLISGYSLIREGERVNNFYMPQYVGVDPNNGNALYHTADGSTTPYGFNLLSNDYAMGGSPYPVFYGSFNSGVKIGNWEGCVALNYSVGGKVYDATYQKLLTGTAYFSRGVNMSKDILERWTPQNRNTSMPALNASLSSQTLVSSMFLTSASYVSLARLYLGYNFQKNAAASFGQLKLYIAAENLFMITGRKGMDPTASFDGRPGTYYAPARNIMFGINVGI